VKLADHTVASGRSLFRWRSYVPFFFLPAWVLAFLDYRPLVRTPGALLAWQLGCVLIAVAGLAVRIHVVGHAPFGTSGRNQAEQKAESLTTTGLYSIARHPLYLGNALIMIGLALLPAVWYLPLIVALGTILYYERIMLAEEAFIEAKYGDAFRDWAANTPAVIPAFRRWAPSALPFSWRTALRGEIYSAVTIALMVLIVDWIQRILLYRDTTWHPLWTPVAAVTFAAWLGVRIAKKRTRLLTVEGR
jgi:protein-S-isoprenylcysteine O-methyltransferase Ste14